MALEDSCSCDELHVHHDRQQDGPDPHLPSPGPLTWYFDAQGDTLTLYGFPGSNSIWYVTLERQP